MTLKGTYSYRNNEIIFGRKSYSFSWRPQCIFDSKLETKECKCSLKEKSVAKLLELKEEHDLCSI